MRCFLRHLKASVPETEVPGASLLPRQPRPKPRLYSNEEIAKLQQATSLNYGTPVRYRNGLLTRSLVCSPARGSAQSK
jgi:hypothetical protein